MDDSFELLDPRNAQSFLSRFGKEARRKGEDCVRDGAVQRVIPHGAGASFSALVQDAEDRAVDLVYDPVGGWEGSCSCPRELHCEHIFAAMSALLAEHRTAAVRRLSAGKVKSSTPIARAGSEPAEAGELPRRLMAATGQPLGGAETKFLRKIREGYNRCSQSRQISYWDFQQMGFLLPGNTWSQLSVWPVFPPNEYEFWLYLANTLQEHGLAIPEFMEPITDLTLVRAKIARWRRTVEIDRWKHLLKTHQPVSSGPLDGPRGEIDLRLVIGEREARLEWRQPGADTFQPLSHTRLRRLDSDRSVGAAHFTPEADLLWQFVSGAQQYGLHTRLAYDDPGRASSLGRALRLPLLETRIVSPGGQPLLRPAERLRWQVAPAESEDSDYRFCLVLPDGSAPAPVLGVFSGHPTLYLTLSSVFAGPDENRYLLDPRSETSIPAPAIEQASGIAFLQSLNVALPPRLQERLRTLSCDVVISCEMKPSLAGGENEDCVVSVTASAPDGRRLAWIGDHWLDQTSNRARRKDGGDGFITVYDSALLAAFPSLLEPLALKSCGYGADARLATRITRKFPEIFAAWLKTVPPRISVKLVGELASLANADVVGSLKLDVTEAEIDWFDLRVVLNVADTTLTPEEINLLLNARGGYVRLSGKGWRRLQYDLTEDENERLARLGLSPRELSAEPQRLHALQLADDAARKFLPAQQVEQLQRRAEELKARVTPDLPAGITAQLRPYQLEGFHFLAYLSTNRFGGILADDMGLGKTLQTLAWLLWLKAQPNAGVRNAPASGTAPALVVCPKSVMDNWRAEAERFAPSLRVKSWSARELDSITGQLDSADLHVLNYSQLRLLGESLLPVQWLALILDEGQYIKNPSSQTAQVARALRAGHRLILSGTPIENRLLDLWSLMSFSMPGVLGSRAQFSRLYDVRGDAFARQRLASRVRPFVLRRTKTQVATDLPDRIEEDLFCEIEGEQKALYRAELKHAQQLLLGIKTQKELARQQFHFLTSLLRLRQICCDPRLMKPDSAAPSAKLDALFEHLEPLMEEGQKVLVFSQFVEMLDLLRPDLLKRNWPLFYLAGDTENRGDLVRKFQAAEGPAVFLISLKAGGFGLNLTAASYVVLFDPWWNPAVENQAIDRTHRIGQVNKVIAYRLLIKDSIEEKIRELQKLKKALAEDVLGEAKFAQSLTLDDLRFLFAD